MANFYAKYPVSGGSGNGVPTYANFAALPGTATNGGLAITLDTYDLYVYETGTGWILLSTPGGEGVNTIGTIDTNTASTDGASIASNVLFMQSASASDPGLVNLTTQTFLGQKTFSTGITGNLTGNASGTAANVTASSNSTLTTLSVLSLPYSQVTGGPSVNALTALTGDGIATGPGSAAFTLATVNGNVGLFGSSTSIPSFTVNGKGLITAASGNAVVAPAGTLSGTTLNATVVSSSLTSVGTLTSGTWNATTIAINHGGTGQTSASAAFNALSPVTTTGDLIYSASGATNSRLAIGSTNQVLTVIGGVPSWQTPSASAGFSFLSSNTSVYGGTNSTLSFTGADNTVIGVSAAAALTSGADNTFIGYNAGSGITNASQNILIGSNVSTALSGTTQVTNNILIGYHADSTNNLTGAIINDLVIIGGRNTFAASGIHDCVFIGGQASQTNASSSGNIVAVGNNITINSLNDETCVGRSITTGSNARFAVVMGSGNTVNSVAGIAIGAQASASSGTNSTNASIAIGGNSTITGNFSVGIGAGDPYQGGGANDNGAANSIILGQGGYPSSSGHTGCFIVSQSTGGGTSDAITSAASQIVFGSSRVSLKDMFIGQGASAVNAAAVNASIQPTPRAGADRAGGSLTITAGNGTGTGGSGAINFQTAPIAGSSSTANVLATCFSISNKGSMDSAAPQTTLTGSAGTAICSQPFQGSSYKKVIIYLNGYTDTGSQTFTFPTAFTNTPYIYGLAAGVSGATVSSSSITFTTTLLSGFVFVEGY